MISRADGRKWRERLAKLRAALPTSKPVVVRFRHCPDATAAFIRDCADCWRITIDPRLQLVSRVDALIHEYAHALDDYTRHGDDYAKQHGPTWGKHYAACYRAIYC